MNSSMEASAPTGIIDNPHTPELYADEAVGFFVHNGNLTVTFCAHKTNYSTNPAKAHRVVTGRVVMPVKAAQSLALGLFDYLKRINLDPAAAIIAGETKQ